MKLLILLLALSVSTPSLAEQKEGGGGSGVAAEFIEAAHDLIERLQRKPIDGVSLDAFKAAVAETKVLTKKKLVLRGAAVDAINYPSQKLIEVSVSRWNELKSTPWVKLQIAFHEYLGILEIDDSDYKVSRQILNSDLCSRTPTVVRAVELALRRSCDQITLKDMSFVTELAIRDLDVFKTSDFKDLHFLGRLQILSTLSQIAITSEFTKLLPAIYSLDISAKEVVVKPGAFNNSTLTYLALTNAKLRRGSLKGLNAEIVIVTEIHENSAITKLEEEFATEDYACAVDAGRERTTGTMLACQKI